MRPADLPGPDHHPHGTRARYVNGCRCGGCRAANSEYERLRYRQRKLGRAEPGHLVAATRARRHLLALRAAGTGRRAVAEASGVPASTVADVASGKKLHLRASTEARLLAVEPVVQGGTLVPAGPTAALLADLERRGWTEAELAARMGLVDGRLQLNRAGKVLARTAQQVRRLHWQLAARGGAP